jgi:protocatechuate 3,4-dioxygenase beta subunit
VQEGRVTSVDIAGHAGARVAGRVTRPDGQPVAGANVAMVYLDVSRVLFSADGRTEPVETDEDGWFVLDRVAPGRVAFVAAADGLAPSGIEERAVVDRGRYDDIELVLGDGSEFRGLVVDDAGRPIAGASVELRPMERPRDPEVLKMMLKIRQVDTTTGVDGRFFARGLTGERLFLEVRKPGYVTEVKFGVKLDEQDIRIELTRGVTVRGRVAAADGEPVQRFRVDTRSRRVDESGEAVAEDGGGRRGRRGQFSFGVGGAGGRMPEGSMRLREGAELGDRGFGGEWQDFQAADGRFEVRGVPPGKVRVRVRADGWLDPESQEVVLGPGDTSEDLAFTLSPGAIARGIVVDGESGVPIAEAQVTAYRGRGTERGGGMFRADIDAEDFDFLGLSADGRRSILTDSKGRFEIDGLSAGQYRFTARHPDKAKSSAADVEIALDHPTEDITIRLGAGGSIEGLVTGAGKRPLADALIVSFSISAGSFKSDSSDRDGNYRIDGLPPGQYIVFKSRMDEQSSNLGYDLMGNMRLKTVTVRDGKVARLDVHDEDENTVRVFGTVRDGEGVVGRALVTAIGADRDGIFGMGIRAKPTDDAGRYELIGLKPGSYFFQVTRFAGRPEQASLSVDVPDGVREHRIDLDLPQSFVAGRVVDKTGQPVAGVRVSAGVESGGLAESPGLLGLIMKNGVAQARTAEDGAFKLERMAAGTYRISASGRDGRRGQARYGEAVLEDIVVDGRVPVDGLVLTLPLAGTITGLVVDGSGNPVPGAELHWSRDGAAQRSSDPEQVLDLLGVQQRPERSNGDGRFQLQGVTPGTYRVRADADGLSPGVAEDVVVTEGGTVDVVISVVRGAKLRVRARNIDGTNLPIASLSLLDGRGKPLASNVSVMSVFRRLMGNQQKKDDSGWHELGNVPPDTYTLIVWEKDKPEIRITREIRDGETVEWDIDVAVEMKRAGR